MVHSFRLRILAVFAILSVVIYPCLANEPTLLNDANDPSPFAVASLPKEKRGFLPPPLVSFFLPGFDQWWEGQYTYAGIYTGLAVGAGYYRSSSSDHKDSRHEDLAQGFYTLAGGMSMYHAFRTAVRSRQGSGEFTFLKHEESPSELALSPFHVSYLSRITTLIPVGLGIGLGLIGFSKSDRTFFPSYFTASDAYFASARSYQAGVWEEAVFRGTLMPIGMHYMNSPFASNLLSSALFGAAHLRSDFIPWP